MRAFRLFSLRRRLAAIGCILLALPGLFLASPLLAGQKGMRLTLRIDLSDRAEWRVDWWQEWPALPSTGEWQVEPFIHEGLARLERLWPAGAKHAALEPAQDARQSIHDASPNDPAPGWRGAFRLRPMGPGQGLDQSFAFPATVPGRLRIEIIGLTPATTLDMSGLDLSEEPLIGGTIILEGRIEPASPTATGFASPVRMSLSNHGNLDNLARALLAPFEVTLKRPKEPVASPPPNRANLLALVRQFNMDERGNGFDPSLGRSLAEPAPTLSEHERLPGPLDHAVALMAEMEQRGWASRLVLSNRRPVPGPTLHPVFLFDTVLVEAPGTGVLLDPVNGVLLDSDAPHLELGGKATLVIDGSHIERRSFRPLRPADHHLIQRAQLSLDHAGAIDGQSLTEARGTAKPLLARLIQRLEEQPGRQQELLRKQGHSGTIRLGFMEEGPDRLRQHLTFALAAPTGTASMPTVQAGAGPRLFRAPLAHLMPVLRERVEGPVACHPLRLEQHLVLHLPDSRILLDVLPDLRVEEQHGSYQARYRLETGHLHVERRLELNPPGPLCSADMVRELAPVLRAAGRDFDRAINIRRTP